MLTPCSDAGFEATLRANSSVGALRGLETFAQLVQYHHQHNEGTPRRGVCIAL